MTIGLQNSPLAAPSSPALDDIQKMGELLSRHIAPTPLVQLDLDLQDRRIFLKLETLSPIGAFKIRPALGALLSRDRRDLELGVATVSSGNLAYGMAWAARSLEVPMVAYMYNGAPQAKIDGVRRLEGEVRFVSQELWWDYITQAKMPDGPETFINPVTDPGVLTGNGTIGLELLEQLPGLSSVWAPFGGGSLITGIAGALKASGSKAEIYAVESDHAAPATAALAAGKVCSVPVRPSFIRSMGGPTVVPGLWPLTQKLLSGTAVLTEKEIVEAVRFIHGNLLLQRQDDPTIVYQENNNLYADASVFGIFSFPLLRGDPKTALEKPFSIVLTEETARRYFGDEDPMGKIPHTR